MYKSSFKKYIIFILLFFTLSIGFSSWVIVGEKSINLGEASVNNPVCYYNSLNGAKKEYTRIEKALEDANDEATSSNPLTVFVYINTNPTIYEDCTIGNYTTLCVPYSDDGTYFTETFGTLSVFADTNPNLYRKNKIVIYENVTITNYGKLLIGGIFGKENQGMTGAPNGDYCEIAMMKKSKIISYGQIDNYGFIKEADVKNNGSVLEAMPNSIVNIPFIVYDLKSVPDMVKLYGIDPDNIIGSIGNLTGNNSQCPFDMFDICSVQVKFKIHSTSSINGKFRMEVDNQYYTYNVVIVGPTNDNTAMILNSGYMILKYQPKVDSNGKLLNYTPNLDKDCYTKVDLYGELTLGSIQFSFSYVVSIPIDTQKMHFPISYKLKFTVKEDGVFNAIYRIKFLPGSLMKVEKGGTLNVDTEMIFYPSSFNEDGLYSGCGYPSGMGEVKFINNGTIIINGQIGGFISNETDGAVVYVNKTPKAISALESISLNIILSMDINDNQPIGLFGYESYNTKWIKNINRIASGSISSSNGLKSEQDKAFTTTLELTVSSPNTYKSIVWEVSPSDVNLSNLNDSSPLIGEITLPAKNTDTTYTFIANITDAYNVKTTASIELIADHKEGGCFASYTLVTMGDGSQKEVKDIVPGEEILSFNHFTGDYESTKIAMLVNHGYDYYDVMNLEFSNGSKIKFMAQHGLFEVESK